jgi:hypothetical protein
MLAAAEAVQHKLVVAAAVADSSQAQAVDQLKELQHTAAPEHPGQAEQHTHLYQQQGNHIHNSPHHQPPHQSEHQNYQQQQ